MYRFKIYSQESPDKGDRYYWKLVSSCGDRTEVVARSRGSHPRVESGSEVRALRRAARARVEDSRSRPLRPGKPDLTFRLVPDVARLRSAIPKWPDPCAPEPRPDWREPAPPAAEAQPAQTQPTQAQAAATEPQSAARASRPRGTRAPRAGRDRTPRTT